MLWTYRVLENDDEGDPLDHGVMRVDNAEAIEQSLIARLEALCDCPCSLSVRVYPVKDEGNGVLESAGDYLELTLAINCHLPSWTLGF